MSNKKEDIDKYSALKASLEMMVSENQEIHHHFSSLLERLNTLENLEDGERRKQFLAMKEEGVFFFNGVDIRLLIKTNKKPLPPPLFFNRTRRRLKNTIMLLSSFIDKGRIPDGVDLKDEIEALTFVVVDENNHKAVAKFKDQVESLRQTPRFLNYMTTKEKFIHKDSDLKTDAEFIATKENVENGEELCEARDKELAKLATKLEKNEITLEQAEIQTQTLAQEAIHPEEDLSAEDAADETGDSVSDSFPLGKDLLEEGKGT
ncbi:MAG: hypothetical protein OEW39_16460 [Deltaproteobacteria bacterium]|nr:hypothetical protein [Deltaproteobacteria bacterium]